MFVDKYISLEDKISKKLRALLKLSCFIDNETALIKGTDCNYEQHLPYSQPESPPDSMHSTNISFKGKNSSIFRVLENHSGILLICEYVVVLCTTPKGTWIDQVSVALHSNITSHTLFNRKDLVFFLGVSRTEQHVMHAWGHNYKYIS